MYHFLLLHYSLGQIGFENLKEVSQILGWRLSDEEIDEMIDDADKDFDAVVCKKIIINDLIFLDRIT